MRVGLGELLIIFAVILILFGANRLPEIGKALGKAIQEFRKASKDIDSDSSGAKKDDGNKKT